MAKINIVFNDINYSIEESSFAEAAAELHHHLSTTMSGYGSVINFGGISYNVDSAKLSSATSEFVSYLRSIAGSGSKVVIGGVEYPFDFTKVQKAVSDLETLLSNLHNSEVVDFVLVLDKSMLDYSVLG